MKKITVGLMTAFLSFTFIPTETQAASAKTEMATTSTSDAARAQALLNRVEEIRMMNKTNLSPAEKKELRKELRSVREQLRDIGGGVYISAGALIVILILLIILT